MDNIRDLFQAKAEGKGPIISEPTRPLIPDGVQSYMTSTDLVLGSPDIPARVSVTIDLQNPIRLGTLKELSELSEKAADGDTPSMTDINDPAFHEGAVCLVAASDRDVMKDVYASRASTFLTKASNGVFKDEYKGIYPGTDADWRAFDLFHEDGHCRDLKDGDGLTGTRNHLEMTADATATAAYYKAYRDGVVSNPEVPYANRGFRAIEAMLGVDKDYSATSLIALPGEEDVLKDYTSPDEASKAMYEARNDILFEIGQLAEPDREDYRAAFRALLSEDGVPFEDAVTNKGDVAPEYAQAHAHKMQAIAGQRLAWEQPALLYETSRQMLEQDAFAGNPAGEKFVERFVDAAQRYERDVFSVDEADMKTGLPDIVASMITGPSMKTSIQPNLGVLP